MKESIITIDNTTVSFKKITTYMCLLIYLIIIILSALCFTFNYFILFLIK